MDHDIFISYSSKQKSVADSVCHYLEENGYKCWIAPRDIPAGSAYGDLIDSAIVDSKLVVLVFSQTASLSKWVKGEISVAFDENKYILPFRIDETKIAGGFRVMLNQMHWVDAFPRYSDYLPALLESVTKILGIEDPSEVRITDINKTKKQEVTREHKCFNSQEESFVVLKADVLKDMRRHPQMYGSWKMRILLGYVDRSHIDKYFYPFDNPAYRFLAAGYTLSMEELVEEGIVPDNPCIRKSIIEEDWEEMPRYTRKDIGTYPSKRNDVFFMGIPCSGKTCVLSGIVYELWKRGEVTCQPHNNERGQDLCQDYYFYLINAVRHCKVPVIVGSDVLCFMKLDVGKNREVPMTMVKFSGEEFNRLASFSSEGKPLSDFSSDSLDCLANNNDKTLLFIVEYTHSLERINLASTTLYKAISFLDNNGPYRSPMSDVRSVAIVVTKTDLMGAGLSYDQRKSLATEFLGKHFRSFLSSMIQLCRKYNINESSKNEVVVFPFTLGTFYLANTFQFNNEDSKRLIDFLESETGKTKRKKHLIK